MTYDKLVSVFNLSLMHDVSFYTLAYYVGVSFTMFSGVCSHVLLLLGMWKFKLCFTFPVASLCFLRLLMIMKCEWFK